MMAHATRSGNIILASALAVLAIGATVIAGQGAQRAHGGRIVPAGYIA
jgi:hypothetical protein